MAFQSSDQHIIPKTTPQLQAKGENLTKPAKVPNFESTAMPLELADAIRASAALSAAFHVSCCFWFNRPGLLW